MLTGSCLCGAARYEAHEVIGPYVYCHCRSCRKANGTAFAANIAVPVAAFRLVSGTAQLRSYESTPGKLRYFCGQCGSPIYTAVGEAPKMYRIRLGTLDDAFAERPAAHIFVGEKAPWHAIEDGAPEYAGWPDPKALQISGSRQRKS